MAGRTHSQSLYRFGFNGQERDDDIAGTGNTNTALFWEYDSRLGRRWNIDPEDLINSSSYSAFRNSPQRFNDIKGDAPFGDYYSESGKYIGSDGKSDDKVYMVKDGNYFKSGNNFMIFNYIGPNNKEIPGYFELKSPDGTSYSHKEFKRLCAVLYAEIDGTTNEAIEEAAGVYSVLENRAKERGTTPGEQASVGNGVYGASVGAQKRYIDEKGPVADKKRIAVTAGLIKGIISDTDFSNGAYFWDGKDFNSNNKTGTGGNKARYKPGYLFTNVTDDLWGQGSNKNPKQYSGGSVNYMYQSTTAKGKTTFSKFTDEYRTKKLGSKDYIRNNLDDGNIKK